MKKMKLLRIVWAILVLLILWIHSCASVSNLPKGGVPFEDRNETIRPSA